MASVVLLGCALTAPELVAVGDGDEAGNRGEEAGKVLPGECPSLRFEPEPRTLA
jgi:hypothetical protein